MPTSKHIVVVEDEADLAELVAYNLERAGYQVPGRSRWRGRLRAIDATPPI